MKEVTAIFDIGKTNKKLLLFDADCNVLHEYSETLPEILDDDGFPCEDIQLLKKWIEEKWNEIVSNNDFNISALNFTSYGASLVHLDENDEPVTPLYSYLKPFPSEITDKLYERYIGKWNFSIVTASPPLGMLNSGLQLLWLKHYKSELFSKIKTSLHLPQYLSFIFSKTKVSEFTSIGCHTALWDFTRGQYHQWVLNEGIDKLLAPVSANPVTGMISVNDTSIPIGTGLHDSSSALIPYMSKFKEPFILISSGTWCINLNPFNTSPLTKEELSKDCLCYLTPEGKPIKASRIFAGKEFEFQVERIAKQFGKSKDFYQYIKYDPTLVETLLEEYFQGRTFIPSCMENTGPFSDKETEEWNLGKFSFCAEAYTQLLIDLTCMLKYSIQLIDTPGTKTIFVEGGFGDNETFMNLLANQFPGVEVSTSFLKQATALGAALRIKESSVPEDWRFGSYQPTRISILLKKYYNRFISERLTSLIK